MRKVLLFNFHFKISTNLAEYQLDHGDIAESPRVNLGSLLSPVVEDLTGPPVEAEVVVSELLTAAPGQRKAGDRLTPARSDSEPDTVTLQSDLTWDQDHDKRLLRAPHLGYVSWLRLWPGQRSNGRRRCEWSGRLTAGL